MSKKNNKVKVGSSFLFKNLGELNKFCQENCPKKDEWKLEKIEVFEITKIK